MLMLPCKTNPSLIHLQVDDDTRSVHSFHPITESKINPFGVLPEVVNTDAAAEEEQQSGIKEERRKSMPLTTQMSREESFGDFVMDVLIEGKESKQNLPCRARLDTGMTGNAVSHAQALMLGYPIQEYDGDPYIMADGSLYEPIGQVSLPFHFVNFRTAKTWYMDFIVFPDSSPFDLCLGSRFIALASLLKRKPEALPVEFRKLKPRKILYL